SSLNNPNPKTKEIRYDQFYEALKKGDVESMSLQPVRNVLTVEGTLKGYEEGEKFTTNVLMNDEAIIGELQTLGTTSNPEIQILPAPETSAWVAFFTGLVPFIIIIILFF